MSEEKKIKSVDQFIKKITEINNLNPEIYYIYNRIPMYYRGQANYEWELEPGLFRNSLYKKNINEIILEFENQYPDELIKLNGNKLNEFEKITKMQHYGFPTNFSDFTENPLIALFFACSDPGQIHKDGAVFVCNSFLFNSINKGKTIIERESFSRNNPMLSILNEIKREKKEEGFVHLYSLKDGKLDSFHKPLFLKLRDGYEIKCYLPLFFSPGNNLSRTSGQKSVFLVFFDRVNSKLEDLKNKNILGAEISLKKIEKNTGYYFSKFAINTNLYLKPQNIEQDQEKQKPKNLELKNNSTVLKIDKKNKRNILMLHLICEETCFYN
jgi:hypothetical protein